MFKISILEYLGKYETGILVLVSIVHNNIYYEGTYFYTDNDIVLTIPEELEIILGHHITLDTEYPEIIKFLIKNVVPYKEMSNRLDDINFNRWVGGEIEYESGEDIEEEKDEQDPTL